MELSEVGPLRVRRVVIGAKPADNSSGTTVVLMHGFGAPGDDLVGLAHEHDAPAGTTFLFPEARHDLAAVMGMPVYGGARAWWMIDMERMQRAIARGEMRDLRRENPEGLALAREQVIAMLDALPSERLVLGGFSQGAMLATDVALHTSRPLAGLVLLSGTLLAEDVWRPRLASRAGLEVFQSHGTEDPILPYSLAEQLRSALLDAGMRVRFRSFVGGHGIPPEVMRDLAAWLRDRVS